MDMSKMSRQEIEGLLLLLAEFEREELELIMNERQEAERMGQLRKGSNVKGVLGMSGLLTKDCALIDLHAFRQLYLFRTGAHGNSHLIFH
jgi:hypothetical protein